MERWGEDGEMEMWRGGEVERWRGGEMERWGERWRDGEVEREMDRWRDGEVERCGGGDMERWNYGDMERCNYGDMERWKDRDGEMERQRDREMEIWRHGEVEKCSRSRCAVCISCLLARLLPSTFSPQGRAFCRRFFGGGKCSWCWCTAQRGSLGTGRVRREGIGQELGGSQSLLSCPPPRAWAGTSCAGT